MPISLGIFLKVRRATIMGCVTFRAVQWGLLSFFAHFWINRHDSYFGNGEFKAKASAVLLIRSHSASQ